jgi:hypothetical protein
MMQIKAVTSGKEKTTVGKLWLQPQHDPHHHSLQILQPQHLESRTNLYCCVVVVVVVEFGQEQAPPQVRILK